MTGKVVAIIQARMSSSRLPGKVLMEIAGRPMLARVVQRVKRARTLNEVLVATTTEATDDVIEQYCIAHRVECSRGSQFDVLDRYYRAAKTVNADTIVRITSDCPVIDPALIDQAVQTLTGVSGAKGPASPRRVLEGLSFVANRLPPPWKRTFPIGLDTEACTFQALESAWHWATEPQQREHVMPYLYEGAELAAIDPTLSAGVTPRGFKIALLECEQDLGKQRWTVDAPEDLEFIRHVYQHFEGQEDFSWLDVLGLVLQQPELARINAGVHHKALGEVDERTQDMDGR